MHSTTTERFRNAFERLPSEIKHQARRAFKLWRADPYHPSLRFKQVHTREPIYSARIGRGYRAVGVKKDNTFVWFWISSHSEYEELISRL